MGAPIFRYSDSRLCGHLLTKPHQFVYKTCFKNFSNPVHPRNYKIVEYATRLLKATIGLIGILLLSPITLIGRLSQIMHYHCLSDTEKSQPKPVIVNGIILPKLKETNHYETCYHGTHHDAAESICNNGFNFSKSGAMGTAIYVTDYKDSAKKYGQAGGIFIINLDVNSREIAELSMSVINPCCTDWVGKAQEQFDNYCRLLNKENSPEQFQSSLRDLFLKNGYRAVRYTADVPGGSFSAIAIYDSSILCIHDFKPRKGVSIHLGKKSLQSSSV